MPNSDKRFLINLFVFVFFFVTTISAQQSAAPSPKTVKTPHDYVQLSRTARQYLQNKNFKQAAEAFELLTKENPADGNNWLMLATALYELKQYRETIDAYQKSSDLGFFDAALSAYQIAKCYAFLGDKENALNYLEKALQFRYRNRTRIYNDAAFKFLQPEPRFRRLAGQVETTSLNRAQGWQTDLDYLISEVKRVHYRFSKEPLPTEFLSMANELRRRLNRLSDAEIVVKFQRLLAALGDGHTLIYPFGMKRGVFKHLPLSFYWFSDGLFIVDASKEFQSLIGKKVLKFGLIDTQTALKKLEPIVSRDNPMGIKWTGVVYLTFPDYLKEIGAINDPKEISLLLEDPRDQARQAIKISPVEVNPDEINIKLTPLKLKTSTPVPLYLSRTDDNYWFQKIADETIYFQFNQTQNKAGESFTDFSLGLRRALDEHKIKNLIIDVRHNNGGEATILRELYRTLINFETTRSATKIYVLIGRDTFSAAQTFISTINHLTGAIYAGEPSGSKPNRVGDEAQFVLPYSGTIGVIASGYNQAASKDNRLWIAPDIPIELSSNDYFNNRDPLLEQVLEIIKTEKSR